MRTDAIIFILSAIVLGVIALLLSIYLKNKEVKKSVLIIPSLFIGVGLGIVISIMADGTFLEALVVVGVLSLISLGYSLMLLRMRKAYQSFRKKINSKLFFIKVTGALLEQR